MVGIQEGFITGQVKGRELCFRGRVGEAGNDASSQNPGDPHRLQNFQEAKVQMFTKLLPLGKYKPHRCTFF